MLRRMAIHFGVIPQEMPACQELNELIRNIDRLVIEQKYAKADDRILIVAGWSPGTPGTMNGMVIHTVGQQWTPTPSAQVLRQLARAERE